MDAVLSCYREKSSLILFNKLCAVRDDIMRNSTIVLFISGFITWLITIFWGSAVIRDVTGGTAAVLAVGVLSILYVLVMLSRKENRSPDGRARTVMGLLISLSASCILSFIIFFPGGKYMNYGITGVHLFIAIFVMPVVISGITVTIIAKRRTK